ncbi:MAG TPA: bifunctional 3-(3-hydroxy-phenyl)propionate/3-hydroxycinnamic acid hydroxylase [Myxococcaceae bacterium]|nr:bifunctional 3-(3-hydroxy-phenyl)propionate/3-hydroxycinnamic acid hydroxylase [Myxococcaceae bacterium]
MTPVEETDVLIVGCGPVGALAANLLGQHGVRVIVLERDVTPHSQPRAITCDDEALRIYQAAGLADILGAHMYACPEVEFVGRQGERFARIVFQGLDFGNGWPVLHFFSQPYVEQVLRQGLRRFPHVELRLGQRVDGYEQDDHGVTVVAHDVAGGPARTLRAKYLLGCDGGRSTLRHHAGIEMVGSTYEEAWLAVSLVLPETPPTLTRFVCDAQRPMLVTRCAGNEMRIEAMLRPGERPEELTRPEVVRQIISPYVKPERATILRAATYIFNRRTASRWRDGRMLLLGDAAHLMPPFMGQGLVSGLRDAANLTWKLACVVHGLADDSLLDTYQQERRPHAEAMIQASVNIGHVILTQRSTMAVARDFFFKTLDRIPRVQRFITGFEFKPQPLIPRGCLPGGARRHRQAPEGQYFPQPRVGTAGGEVVRLDDTLGPGFAVVVRPDTPEPSRRAAEVLAESLGARCVQVLPSRAFQARPGEVVDVEGRLDAWFREHDAEVAVLRPDRYLFGAVRGSHLGWLSLQLRAWIRGPLPVVAPLPGTQPSLRYSAS